MTIGSVLGRIPISFRVTTRFAVQAIDGGLGGLRLTEEAVTVPYEKDYDALTGEGPPRWRGHFDLSNWGILVAAVDTDWIGGATVAWNTSGMEMLEDRDDLAAMDGAGVRGCREILDETQSVNAAACRFYARQGCALRTIRQGAYPELPDETQLLWHRSLPDPQKGFPSPLPSI